MMSLLLNTAFTADDVDVLHCALDCWCTEKRIDMKSAEAQLAAAAALNLFESGYNTSDKLLLALRSQRPQ